MAKTETVTSKYLRKYGSYMVIDEVYITRVDSQILIISFQRSLDYYSGGTCHTYMFTNDIQYLTPL
jgi:hypothetical protein